jgi:hypothetical protein
MMVRASNTCLAFCKRWQYAFAAECYLKNTHNTQNATTHQKTKTNPNITTPQVNKTTP